MKKLILFLVLFCSLISQAYSKNIIQENLTHQEAILLSCLHTNYAQIGVDLKDYSGNHYTLDTLMKISNFVARETGDFYKKQASIYMDNAKPPYTLIFNQCVRFSKSNKVKRFLRTLDLTICTPKSKHEGC